MHRILAAAALAALLTACGLNDPKSERGFRLPDGDPEAGKKAFVDLGCYTCHEVEGIDAKFAGTGAANIKLGGETTIVRSYGELVTAIINPSHKIAVGADPAQVAPEGQSLMEIAALNDRMTVRQLTDLVAFLQTTYKVVPPPYNPYTRIYP
jgi:mono/diheme cytochrome c family protein